MKRFSVSTPWARPTGQVPEIAEIETSQPARPADLMADLMVPLGQAMITGALLGGVFVLALGELVPSFDGDLLKVWGMAALGISALAWVVLLADTRRLLWAVERLIGRDLDNDNQVGQPERLVFVDRERARQEAEQERKQDAWTSFLGFVRRLPTKGTALAAWERDIGRDNYARYRDALIDYGFGRWNSYRDDGQPNKSQGWALVHDVAYILERLSISGGA